MTEEDSFMSRQDQLNSMLGELLQMVPAAAEMSPEQRTDLVLALGAGLP